MHDAIVPPLCKLRADCSSRSQTSPPLSLSPRTIIPLAGESERGEGERGGYVAATQLALPLLRPFSQERSSSRCSRPLRPLYVVAAFARSFLPPPLSLSLVFPNRPSTIKFQALCRRFEARSPALSVGQARPTSLAHHAAHAMHAHREGAKFIETSPNLKRPQIEMLPRKRGRSPSSKMPRWLRSHRIASFSTDDGRSWKPFQSRMT